jgi:hypothetical protein
MAANVYMRTIQPSKTGWQALADTSLVLNAWIYVWTVMAVTDPLEFRVNGGDPASLPKSVGFSLEGVDLSQIEVQGDGYYRVTVMGYTR